MGIESAMNAVAAKIISSFTGMSANNCAVIDERVFDYIQTTENASPFCVVVDYGGARPSGRTEFRSSSVGWRIYVNYYHLIPGDNTYFTAYQNGIRFIDKLIQEISRDPTLNKSVLAVTFNGSGSPVPYKRGINWYIMNDVELVVMDNIV